MHDEALSHHRTMTRVERIHGTLRTSFRPCARATLTSHSARHKAAWLRQLPLALGLEMSATPDGSGRSSSRGSSRADHQGNWRQLGQAYFDGKEAVIGSNLDVVSSSVVSDPADDERAALFLERIVHAVPGLFSPVSSTRKMLHSGRVGMFLETSLPDQAAADSVASTSSAPIGELFKRSFKGAALSRQKRWSHSPCT